jgi:hypothetical protein
MFTQEVNVDAMYRATTLLFGDQAAMMLAKVADVIDRPEGKPTSWACRTARRTLRPPVMRRSTPAGSSVKSRRA